MYKITNVTDRNGNVKEEFIEEMKEYHPSLSGEILHHKDLRSGMIPVLCLRWNDASGKMLRTSTVEDYEEMEDIITITTRNSIYTLERIK